MNIIYIIYLPIKVKLFDSYYVNTNTKGKSEFDAVEILSIRMKLPFLLEDDVLHASNSADTDEYLSCHNF